MYIKLATFNKTTRQLQGVSHVDYLKLFEQHRDRHVLVVGSGHSISEVADWDLLHSDVIVVAAHHAIDQVPRADYFMRFIGYVGVPVMDVTTIMPGQTHIFTPTLFQHAGAGFRNILRRINPNLLGMKQVAVVAAYWALYVLKPKSVGFIGCDCDFKEAKTDTPTETHQYKRLIDPAYNADKVMAKIQRYHQTLATVSRDKFNCPLINYSHHPVTVLPHERKEFGTLS